jgi:manganese/zinc/iron transport system substrate-binding protein
MLHFLKTAMTGWIAGLICLGLLLTGCGEARVAREVRDGKKVFRFAGTYPIHTVATVGMVADMVRAVGGEHVVVEQMLGAGVDPHLYKATRDDVRLILKADLVFYNGLFLEGKMIDILQKVSQTRPVFALSDGLDQQQLVGDSESEDHYDPHVWMDVAFWSQGIDEVLERLSEYDPQHSADFERNAERYREELRQLDAYAKTTLATIPKERRIFLTSHDAFHYFGRAYDLEVMGIQGISTESEAGLRRVNELVDLIVEKKVPAVFFESSVPQRSIEAIVAGASSRGHRVEILGPLYSDAMGDAGTYEGTYVGMIDHNVTLVARGLGGTAPALGSQGKLSPSGTSE